MEKLKHSEQAFNDLLEENSQLKKKLLSISNSNNSGIERALKAQFLMDHLIIRENSEQQLFQGICNLTLEAGYKLAWIGFISEDKTVRPVVSAGFDRHFLKEIIITWDNDEFSESPTGQALKTGKCVVMQNIMHDPKFEPWRKAAKKNKFKSSVALPLFHDNNIYGAISIYSGEENAFNEEEIKVLSLIVNDLSIGISKIRYNKSIEKQSIELIKAKEITEKNEKKFRALFENANEGIIFLSEEGKIVSLNNSAARMHGYSIEEMINKNIQEFDLDDQSVLLPERGQKLVKGEDFIFEVSHYHKNGNTIDLEVSSCVVELGGINYFIAFHRDITEHKKAIEELRKSKQNWEGIFNGLTTPTVILDSHHNILEINENLRNKLGKDITEIKKLKCWELFHTPGTNSPPPGCPFEKMAATGTFKTLVMEMEAFGGTYLVNCTPLFDKEGKLDKVIHIATDISECKQLEVKLQQNIHELNKTLSYFNNREQRMIELKKEINGLLVQLGKEKKYIW